MFRHHFKNRKGNPKTIFKLLSAIFQTGVIAELQCGITGVFTTENAWFQSGKVCAFCAQRQYY